MDNSERLEEIPQIIHFPTLTLCWNEYELNGEYQCSPSLILETIIGLRNWVRDPEKHLEYWHPGNPIPAGSTIVVRRASTSTGY